MPMLKLSRAIKHIHKIWKELGSPDGWIPWAGGSPPVDRDDEIGIKFKNPNLMPQHTKGSGLDWKHWGSGTDIIAYKVIKKARRKQ